MKESEKKHRTIILGARYRKYDTQRKRGLADKLPTEMPSTVISTLCVVATTYKLFLNRRCEQGNDDADGGEANDGEDVAAKVGLAGRDGEHVEGWGGDGNDGKGHAGAGGDGCRTRSAGGAAHGRAYSDAGEAGDKSHGGSGGRRVRGEGRLIQSAVCCREVVLAEVGWRGSEGSEYWI